MWVWDKTFLSKEIEARDLAKEWHIEDVGWIR
jgi:hypothetical protein